MTHPDPAHINVSILGLGIALVVAAIPATWKAGRLRSEILPEYQSRIALAQAGLDEKAAADLRKLAERVTEVLGGLDADFRPLDVIADPGELLDAVVKITNVLRAQKRLPQYLKWLLRIGPVLCVLLVGTIASLAVTFAYFTGWSHQDVMGYVALAVTLILVAGECLLTLTYFLLLHRFSSAEMLTLPEA